MSVTQKSQLFFGCSSRCVLTVLGLVFLGTLPLSASPCISPVSLDAGAIWRDAGRTAGSDACFSLTLATAGVVSIDVSTAATGVQTRLVWLGAPAQDLATTEPKVLRQAPTGLILVAEAGSYELRVAPEDPSRALPPFRLTTRFSALDAKSETDSEIEIDPMHKSAPGLHDLSQLPDSVLSSLRELCRLEAGDDHAETFTCATSLALGKVVAGELSNDWGDDTDVFRFRVESLATIEIRATGQGEIAASLYDRHGLRLGTALDRGRGLRIVRTLVPGSYFVKLEGQGAYALNAGSVDR